MAQTKTRTGRSSGSSGSTRSRSAGSKANGRRSGSSSTKARSSATTSRSKRTTRSQASPNGAAGSVKAAVTTGAQEAANGISTVAQKAKVPLLASGAALAGVAGAVIATRSGKRRSVLGVPMKRSGFSGISMMPKRSGFKSDARKITGAVTDAAKRADVFGQRVSRVASSVQNVSETANEAVKKT